LHLLLQGADRCGDRGELPLNPIAPEAEHAQLPFLIATVGGLPTVAVVTTAKRREHGRSVEMLRF
jgi:hypothetical protein